MLKERSTSTGNGNHVVVVDRKLEPSTSEDSFWGSDLEEEEELLALEENFESFSDDEEDHEEKQGRKR